MRKIAIVTDSTANIPPAFIQEHQISVAPLVIIWGEETLQDGIDIDASRFYQRLGGTTVTPTTSQPPVAVFEKIFEPLVAQDMAIITILISDLLSGTVHSAQQAKKSFPDAQIAVIDSEMADIAIGLQVMAIAKEIEAGKTFDEIVAIAEMGKHQSGVFFMVDTLEYLHRGGRIGTAKKLLGTTLNLKPILEMQAGKIEPLKSVRTKKKAIDKMIEIAQERIDGHNQVSIFAMHAAAEEDGKQLQQMLIDQTGVKDIALREICPVIGVHTGPGTLGVAYYFAP